MRRAVLLLAVVALLVVPCAGASEPTRAPAGVWRSATQVSLAADLQGMLAEVETQTLMDYVSDLSGVRPVQIGNPALTRTITTRYSDSTELEWAAQYLREFYQRLDIPVEVQRYEPSGWPGRSWPNVVAEFRGTVQPERIVILCAHFDDTSTVITDAPGADDNASGTAALMVAAQIMRPHSFQNTVRFAHFSGEEQQLYGSRAYAEAAQERGDNIVAVLNLDMIAWDGPPTPTMNLYANYSSQSQTIAAIFSEVVTTYGLPLNPQIIPFEMRGSDHAPFWDCGYPAVLAIEDYQGDFNPYYHTPEDRITGFNPAYFTAMARAALGTVVTYALLVSGPPSTATPTATPRAPPWRNYFPIAWVAR